MDSASKETILIVGNTPANLSLLIRGLVARGCNVRAVSSGQEALAMAAEIQPQLILLHVLLPEMDSYQVCLQLKSDQRLGDIPVILLSAGPETVSKVKGFQAGAVDYLAEPFDFDEMLARVEVHLTLYRQHKQLEQLLVQRELAVVQERQRLARNLHDSVIQSLFSANALAEVLPRIIDSDGDRARQYMLELAMFTRTALAEMRSVLVELRPEAFKGIDLGVLMKQLCDLFNLQTGITIELQLSDNIVPPEADQMIFYSVAQEALMNIARHAKASKVAVRLGCQPDGIELRIQDNGCGFDPKNIPAGNGIKLMLERANSIGASLLINSEPDRGTQIILKGNK